MSLRSMTGFARVRARVGDGELTVSLKSVNHRGLDLHFHLGAEFDPYENGMRSLIKQHVRRGHLDVRVSWEQPPDTASLGVNRPLLLAYLSAYRRAAAEFGVPGEPDLNAALRLPGMFTETPADESGAGLEEALNAALAEALQTLNRFREREGEAMGIWLRERAAEIERAGDAMAELRSQVLPAFQTRLRARLQELLEGAPLEPQRLVQEAAILADRSDIGEELTRLKVHAVELLELLRGGGEVGKKLDFLLQEMNRETNTILSKTNGLGEPGLEITRLGLAVKSDIEKIRELSLNLE